MKGGRGREKGKKKRRAEEGQRKVGEGGVGGGETK